MTHIRTLGMGRTSCHSSRDAPVSRLFAVATAAAPVALLLLQLACIWQPALALSFQQPRIDFEYGHTRTDTLHEAEVEISCAWAGSLLVLDLPHRSPVDAAAALLLCRLFSGLLICCPFCTTSHAPSPPMISL